MARPMGDSKIHQLIRRIEGHPQRVMTLCEVGDDIWSGSANGTIMVHQIQSGGMLRKLQAPGRGDDEDFVCALMLVGPYVWCGSSDGAISIFSVKSASCVTRLLGHTGPVACLIEGQRWAWSGSGDGTIRAWDKETGRQQAMLSGHQNWVRCLAVVGTKLWSGSDDSTIRIWDEMTGQFGQELRGHSGGVLSLLPVGSHVWSGSADKTIRVWDAQTGRELRDVIGHAGWVTCLALKNGLVWSGSSDKIIRVWNPQSAGCLQVLQGHQGWVWSLLAPARSPEVWSGGGEACICVWSSERLPDSPAPTRLGIDRSPVHRHDRSPTRLFGSPALPQDRSLPASPFHFAERRTGGVETPTGIGGVFTAGGVGTPTEVGGVFTAGVGTPMSGDSAIELSGPPRASGSFEEKEMLAGLPAQREDMRALEREVATQRQQKDQLQKQLEISRVQYFQESKQLEGELQEVHESMVAEKQALKQQLESKAQLSAKQVEHLTQELEATLEREKEALRKQHEEKTELESKLLQIENDVQEHVHEKESTIGQLKEKNLGLESKIREHDQLVNAKEQEVSELREQLLLQEDSLKKKEDELSRVEAGYNSFDPLPVQDYVQANQELAEANEKLGIRNAELESLLGTQQNKYEESIANMQRTLGTLGVPSKTLGLFASPSPGIERTSGTVAMPTQTFGSSGNLEPTGTGAKQSLVDTTLGESIIGGGYAYEQGLARRAAAEENAKREAQGEVQELTRQLAEAQLRVSVLEDTKAELLGELARARGEELGAGDGLTDMFVQKRAAEERLAATRRKLREETRLRADAVEQQQRFQGEMEKLRRLNAAEVAARERLKERTENELREWKTGLEQQLGMALKKLEQEDSIRAGLEQTIQQLQQELSDERRRCRLTVGEYRTKLEVDNDEKVALQGALGKLRQEVDELTSALHTAERLSADRERQHDQDVQEWKISVESQVGESVAALASQDRKVAELEDNRRRLTLEIEETRREHSEEVEELERRLTSEGREKGLLEQQRQQLRSELEETKRNLRSELSTVNELKEVHVGLHGELEKAAAEARRIPSLLKAVEEHRLRINELEDQLIRQRNDASDGSADADRRLEILRSKLERETKVRQDAQEMKVRLERELEEQEAAFDEEFQRRKQLESELWECKTSLEDVKRTNVEQEERLLQRLSSQQQVIGSLAEKESNLQTELEDAMRSGYTEADENRRLQEAFRKQRQEMLEKLSFSEERLESATNQAKAEASQRAVAEERSAHLLEEVEKLKALLEETRAREELEGQKLRFQQELENKRRVVEAKVKSTRRLESSPEPLLPSFSKGDGTERLRAALQEEVDKSRAAIEVVDHAEKELERRAREITLPHSTMASSQVGGGSMSTVSSRRKPLKDLYPLLASSQRRLAAELNEARKRVEPETSFLGRGSLK